MTIFSDDQVILDSNSSNVEILVDLVPVKESSLFSIVLELFDEKGNEVETWFVGETHARFQDSFFDACGVRDFRYNSFSFREFAGSYIVHVKTKIVTQTVWVEAPVKALGKS